MRTARFGKLKGMDLRPAQELAIDKITNSDKRFIAVRGPTGIGKTCVGFEAIRIPFFYICSSIQLQEQAEEDYPEATLLKGRSNYDCDQYGHAGLCQLSQRCEDCEYQAAKSSALLCSRTILNFHYFLHTTNFTNTLPARNVIIDEADNLETVLNGFISFDFTVPSLELLDLAIKTPSKKTKIEVMPSWIGTCHRLCHNKAKGMEKQVNALRKDTGRKFTAQEIGFISRYQKMKTIEWKLKFLSDQDLSKNWVYHYEEKTKRIILKPIWLKRDLTDKFLFNHGLRFLFMSATMPSKEVFCGMYGIKSHELDYVDLPNLWESEKRKVIYKKSYNVTSKMADSEHGKIKTAVEDILDKETGRGVIHTTNYKLAKTLHGLSDRLIIHNSQDKDECFDRYKTDDCSVFVSPSSTRGLDLPYELCEFIIWLKAPFLYLGDPQVQARVYGGGKFGKMWYASDAVQTIIQGCGRGFRSEDDYCTIYMLDEQIGRLLLQQQKLWPMWFRDIIRFE